MMVLLFRVKTFFKPNRDELRDDIEYFLLLASRHSPPWFLRHWSQSLLVCVADHYYQRCAIV